MSALTPSWILASNAKLVGTKSNYKYNCKSNEINRLVLLNMPKNSGIVKR